MKKSNNKIEKSKHKFTPEEAAGYLRQLSDDLESGAVTLHPEDLELESEIKVKEERKAKKGHTNIKIRLKFERPDTKVAQDSADEGREPAADVPAEEIPAEGAPAEDTKVEDAGSEEAMTEEARPDENEKGEGEKAGGSKSSYKRLKKAMAKDFDKLGKLKDGEDPAELARLVESFAAQGRKMCTYAGKKYGEEYYEGFLAEIKRMEGTARAGDLEGLQAALKALADSKNTCHDKYK